MINPEKLEKLKGESPIISDRYHQRAFKSRYQSDLIKGIVEIIKNSVDAYINEKGEENCSQEEIKIRLENLHTKNPIIKIINFARGMDYNTFKKALRIGEDTSGDKESITGAHGYGMKEAAWAFKNAKIISIHNGKYSTRIFYWDNNDSPKYAWDIDENGEVIDRPVNEAIIKETSITNEGTFFEAIVPDDISCPRPDTLKTQLSNNILLRTINQSDKFKITIEYKDQKSGQMLSLPIRYIPPNILSLREDRKAIELGEFSFNYPNYGIINCSYEIFLSTHELPYTGDTKEAGLLICAGPFAVLDCTLFDHGDKIARRFFGKVLLSGPIRRICKNEKIIDDKREAGLIKKTPLYKNLYKKFNPLLERLIERERKRSNKEVGAVSKLVLDNKIDLIKEFNKIDRQETEESSKIKGDIKFLPGPNGIRFCVPENYLKLIEKQKKNVHIVVDVSQIPIGSEIQIKSNKDGIDINPKEFKISKEEVNKDNIFKKKISFISDCIDTFLVTAHVKGMLNKSELNVDIVVDPRLHIKNPLEFVPSQQDIVAGKSKKFSLIIDFSRLDKKEKILIHPDKIFIINKHLTLNDATKICDNFYELLIPVYCSGKPKQKGKIEVSVGEHRAVLELEVISSKDRHLKGDFEGIDEDKTENPEELSYYDNKIIYVCVNHPILRHYRRTKEGEKNIAYRVLFSDAIVREFCKTLARKKVKPFENVSAEEFRVRFNQKFEELYNKHSTRLHKLCINPKNLEKLKIN